MALPTELQDTYRNSWQLVQDAAGAKDEQGNYVYTVTDLISAASELAREAGQAMTLAENSALATLFGLARGNFRSADRLISADPMSAITSGMVGEWPTAAPAAEQAAQPQYMAKAQFSYTNALGETSYGWVTLTGLNFLPPSVSNLQLRMKGAAETAYSRTPEEGGTPTTDAEVMAEFGAFTDLQLYAV